MAGSREQTELIRRGVLDGRKAYCGPEHVVVDLTNRCRNNCIACWTKSPLLGDARPGPEWHRQQLQTDVVMRLIDDLATMGTSILRFTGGGEPFLHPDILPLLSHARSRGMFCSVTTSLNMLAVSDVERLLVTGVDELSVSLWAPDASTYQATHPNAKADVFDRISDVLKEIGRRKKPWLSLPFAALGGRRIPRVNILNVISSLNFDRLEAMYDFALAVRADAIYFAVVDPVPGATDALLLSGEQCAAAERACERIATRNAALPPYRQLQLDNFAGFRQRLQTSGAACGEYDAEHIDAIPCYIGWIFCRVMADGQVAPCCRGVHRPMGNLNEMSFRDIWDSPRYEQFRDLAKNAKKDHPYFKPFGCGKTCDNLMHNHELHQRLFS